MLGFLIGSVQPNLRLVDIRRGKVPSPDGLGDPTPTGSGCEVSAVFNPCNLLNPRFRRVSSYASRFTDTIHLSLYWGFVGSFVHWFICAVIRIRVTV